MVSCDGIPLERSRNAFRNSCRHFPHGSTATGECPPQMIANRDRTRTHVNRCLRERLTRGSGTRSKYSNIDCGSLLLSCAPVDWPLKPESPAGRDHTCNAQSRAPSNRSKVAPWYRRTSLVAVARRWDTTCRPHRFWGRPRARLRQQDPATSGAFCAQTSARRYQHVSEIWSRCALADGHHHSAAVGREIGPCFARCRHVPRAPICTSENRSSRTRLRAAVTIVAPIADEGHR